MLCIQPSTASTASATNEPAVVRWPNWGWRENVARISEIAPQAAIRMLTNAPARKIEARCSKSSGLPPSPESKKTPPKWRSSISIAIAARKIGLTTSSV